jgi:signal transduction histidine kinase
MRAWRWVRADLRRPEVPCTRQEAPFLVLSATAIVVVAQATDPGSAGRLALLILGAGGFVLRAFVPRLPAEVFAVVVIVPVAFAVAGGQLEVGLFLVVLMVLDAAWHLGSTLRAAAIAVAAAFVPWAEAILGDVPIGWVPWAAAAAFTFALGRSLRSQRALIDELRATREALADAAVAAERRRIALELHDLAGHTLAAMMLHVTGARHVLERDPAEARRALVDAEAVGRTSLDQIRTTVAALRTSERGTDPPLGDAGDLAALVDEYRRAGLVIDVDVSPAATAVAGPVGVATHRIVREALANVARHARAERVTVTVGLVDGNRAVGIEVADHGLPVEHRGVEGFGLLGMRERARGLGGTLDAGPTVDGWRVRATLPLVEPT